QFRVTVTGCGVPRPTYPVLWLRRPIHRNGCWPYLDTTGWGPRGDSGSARGRVRATQPGCFLRQPCYWIRRLLRTHNIFAIHRINPKATLLFLSSISFCDRASSSSTAATVEIRESPCRFLEDIRIPC